MGGHVGPNRGVFGGYRTGRPAGGVAAEQTVLSIVSLYEEKARRLTVRAALLMCSILSLTLHLCP